MKQWGLVCILFAVLLGISVVRKGKQTTYQRSEPTSSALPETVAAPPRAENTNLYAVNRFHAAIDELKGSAVGHFDKLTELLQPYGKTEGAKQVYVQESTNSQGGVRVEIEVRTGSHKVSYRAGPLNPVTGENQNPSRTTGLYLSTFESLFETDDVRRKPSAMNEWYRSTGTWTEKDAVAETMRIVTGLGIPADKVLRHRFRSSSITVKNPAGEQVRVTPFFRVDVYDTKEPAEGHPGFLDIQFRIDESPPARVTRLSVWPPVKVP